MDNTLNLRGVDVAVLFPASGPATVTIEATLPDGANADLSGTNLALWVQSRDLDEPTPGSAIATATRDTSDAADGTVVFTFADVSPIRGTRRVIILADGDVVWTVGYCSAENTGAASQATRLPVTLATATLSIELTAAPGGGGGASLPIEQSDVTGLPEALAARQLTSEKNQPNGYVGLDGSGLVPDNRLPASIARDTEIGSQITVHNTSESAHPDIRALIAEGGGSAPADQVVVGSGDGVSSSPFFRWINSLRRLIVGSADAEGFEPAATFTIVAEPLNGAEVFGDNWWPTADMPDMWEINGDGWEWVPNTGFRQVDGGTGSIIGTIAEPWTELVEGAEYKVMLNMNSWGDAAVAVRFGANSAWIWPGNTDAATITYASDGAETVTVEVSIIDPSVGESAFVLGGMAVATFDESPAFQIVQDGDPVLEVDKSGAFVGDVIMRGELETFDDIRIHDGGSLRLFDSDENATMRLNGETAGFRDHTGSYGQEDRVQVLSAVYDSDSGDIRAQWEDPSAGGDDFTLWTIDMFLIGVSVPDLIGMVGWGSATSGIYWDDTQQLLLKVDQDAETITTLEPREDDLAFVVSILDVGGGTGSTPNAVTRFDADPKITTSAWLDLSSPATRALIASKASAADLDALEATVANLQADDIGYDGTGIFALAERVGQGLHMTEGTLDRWRWVSATASTATVLNLAALTSAPVAVQPVMDYGVTPARGTYVFLHDRANPAENGIYLVGFDDTGGQWVKQPHPNVFVPYGNGYRVRLNAPGSDYDGREWTWSNDDVGDTQRGHLGDEDTDVTGRWHQTDPVDGVDLSSRIAALESAPAPNSYSLGAGTAVTSTTLTSLMPSPATFDPAAAGDSYTLQGAHTMVNNSGGGSKATTLALFVDGVQVCSLSQPGYAAGATVRPAVFTANVHVVSPTQVTGSLGVSYPTNGQAAVGTATVDLTTAFDIELRGSVQSASPAGETITLAHVTIQHVPA